MLTTEGCRDRQRRFLERLDGTLGAGAWDTVVIHRPEHLLYLANFYPLPNSLNLQSSNFLLLEPTGAATLFTDNWLDPGELSAADEVITTEWYTCQCEAENRAILVADAVRQRLEKLRTRKACAELGHLPHQVASSVETWLEIEPILRTMREIKDADELGAIRRGVRTAEAMHAASRGILRPGMTELELYGQLLAHGVLAAGTPFVMMCDLASGPRAAQGGGAPTSRKIQNGELVILDFFPYVEGYRGDIANTLVAGGKPTQEQEDHFGLVHAALKAAEGLLEPGVPVSEVHRAMDATIRDPRLFPGLGGKRELGHHAGHAIGLCHPEAPELVPKSDRVLAEGMVVTLEPGFYGAPTGGVRLEHNYLVTQNGAEQLSHHKLGLA